MKILLALAASLLLLAGCGSDGDATATDPAGSMPTSIPAAPGPVRTLSIATVMDTGSPELCLGAVAESYPPQCSGPPIAGWDWSDHRGTYEAASGVRWGAYNVGGTWDGTTFTATDAVTAALYDPAMQEPTAPVTPEKHYTTKELADIQDELADLPGILTRGVEDGRVVATVVYDDGSLQAWADDQYGAGVVDLTSMLVDVQS